MKKQKLSVSLGVRDKLEKTHASLLDDMFQKFKSQQNLFRGQLRTYTALDGFADDPSKRGYTHVSSTVKEQLDWYTKYAEPFLTNTLSVEKTNSTGIKAKLVVQGVEWGEYSTLELLRLKSILDSKLKAMIHEIPVRKDSVIWHPSTNADFAGRDVFETPLDENYAKTTQKRTEIVHDPHIKEAPNRAPVSVPIETTVNIGKYTSQDFSGEFTLQQRAEIFVKMDQLYTAVIEALATANEADTQESDLGKKVLNYLF